MGWFFDVEPYDWRDGELSEKDKAEGEARRRAVKEKIAADAAEAEARQKAKAAFWELVTEYQWRAEAVYQRAAEAVQAARNSGQYELMHELADKRDDIRARIDRLPPFLRRLQKEIG